MWVLLLALCFCKKELSQIIKSASLQKSTKVLKLVVPISEVYIILKSLFFYQVILSYDKHMKHIVKLLNHQNGLYGNG